MPEKKKFGAKWILIVLLVMGASVAAALTAAAISRKNREPQVLEKVQLKDEILSFTMQYIPGIHSGLVRIDQELVLMEKELLRLAEIEDLFPQRKAIVDTERAEWNRVKRGLVSSLSKIEREVEILFVTHLVNPDKGKERIEKEKESLSAEIMKTLEESRPHTERLKKAPQRGWTAWIRQKIKG